MSKTSKRRPEATKGAYDANYDRIFGKKFTVAMRCNFPRSHGPCAGLFYEGDETCPACGEDRPEKRRS